MKRLEGHIGVGKIVESGMSLTHTETKFHQPVYQHLRAVPNGWVAQQASEAVRELPFENCLFSAEFGMGTDVDRSTFGEFDTEP